MSEQDELERLLLSVGQAALAETLAGVWTHVLGTRPVLVAAGTPPNLNGLENTAQRVWKAALERWVRPVVTWSWRQKIESASADRLWDKIEDRMRWTVDLIVKALTNAPEGKPSPDQYRSQLADVLALDAFTTSLLDEIHRVELALLDPERSQIDTDAAFARRVRLQTNVFVLEASRARSAGFAALARVNTGDDARHLREAAQQARRPASDVRQAERELARHDEKLFFNPGMDPGELARLQAKLIKLNGEGRHGKETWRNSITRDMRAIANGLLNSRTLQYGLDQARETGQPWVKTWHATHDELTRPTHRDADGQQRPIEQPFDIGGAALDHPADFDAPPEEFWNCRCGMSALPKADALALVAADTLMEEPMTEAALDDLPPVMWHGVIVVEDEYTGDRRYFAANSLRTQALPMPIRFQREDWGGHTGAVVTANLEGIRRFGKQIRAWGTFANGDNTPEVNEVISLMGNRMLRGISIDGDDVLDSQYTIELDANGNDYTKFDSLRIRSSTFVAIPAYDEAETYLGPPPPEWLLEGEPLAVEQNEVGDTRDVADLTDEELESLLADVSSMPENLAEYWVHGEGAVKIGWGRSGDFGRCERQLAKYVPPGQVAGTCANLHHRALGVWPGQEASNLEPILAAAGVYETTTAEDWIMTAEMFAPRALGELTPITIDDDGNVYGHIAGWTTCHQAFADYCQTPPRSQTNYALFHTGAVRLSDGTDLPVGKLTLGAGHADSKMGVRGATAHYDNSATAVVVCRAVEDKWGIQVSGRVIPGTPQEKVEELRRSPISGDWRAYRGNLELVAGLAVNSPGFPIPRTMVASVDSVQVALVAAGYVPRDLGAEVDALAARMDAPLVASLAARMEPTQAELDARAAKLAARMDSLTMEA